ncbi:MAG: thiolase family protein [Actinobacteria bacterium]|nr:thiolase family protein [Actinomycetota bacterium]MBU1942147.1 thiolase family protein [Actinomycetota bacterium]MBU2688754.1 thiolase family protein [Actinomycetota bacterium]
MKEVYIIGVGMIKFGKFYDRTLRSMAAEAVDAALDDAGIAKEDIQAAWVGNAAAGLSTGQECIRGQVALRSMDIDTIPIMNVENACASGSSAVHGAWMGISAGLYDCALALGMEKIANPNKAAVFSAFFAGTDVEQMDTYMAYLSEMSEKVNERLREKGITPETGASAGDAGKTRSGAMDIYSVIARYHMARYGSTQRQLAVIASKNHWHSSLNPFAQYQYVMSVDEVMNDREVSWPLTRSMCAPIGDGAAAAILCSREYLEHLDGTRPARVLASVLASGKERDFERVEQDISVRLSRAAYEVAGVGPEDVDLAECHDATAYGELHQAESLGFCPEGEGGVFAESGATRLGGAKPMNTSGGLESRGHPIGATGVAQVHELVTQLRGEAEGRQVEGARVALAMNGGGIVGQEEAAMCVHILEGVR